MNETIIKANRLYQFISAVNHMLLRATDEETLFREACRIAVGPGKFRMAWIGLINEKTQQVLPVMHAGAEQQYLSKIKTITLKRSSEGKGPTGLAIRNGKHIISNDIENDPRMLPWKKEAMKRGYRSSMALPITKLGQVIGAFSIYSAEKNFFKKGEIGLLKEMAGNISFSLGVFEKEKQRKQAELYIAKAAIEAQERERQHIGTELHDNVNQLLVGSLLSLALLKKSPAEKVQQLADKCRDYIKQAITEIRNLSHWLVPASFDEISLRDAFDTSLRNINPEKHYKIKLQFDEFGNKKVDNAIQINLYRILQEQLSNIVKHAHATQIHISVKLSRNSIRMRIHDNGKGFNKKTVRKGIGLNNMKKRAEILSGTCSIHASKGRGCEVLVEIPIKQPVSGIPAI